MSGRRDFVDDKVLVSEVSRQLHLAKANKKLIANTRLTAKKAARKQQAQSLTGAAAPATQAPAPSRESRTNKSRKGGVAQEATALPEGTVPLKSGGSVWVTFKCELDAIHRRNDAAADSERGVEPKRAPFVVPETNTRSRMRAEKAQQETAAVEEEEVAAAVEETPAADGDDVIDAPADSGDADVAAPEEEQAYYVSALETLIASVGAGPTKCVVRTTSSLGRKVLKRAVKGDTKNSKQTGGKKQRRRVKKERSTSLLSTQKQASLFATNFVALLRKDVYPLLRRDAVPEPAAPPAASSKTSGKADAPTAATSHKDPNALGSTKAAAGANSAPSNQKQQQQQQVSKPQGKASSSQAKSSSQPAPTNSKGPRSGGKK